MKWIAAGIACLALGLETREVLRFYQDAGPAMFHRSELVERLWYLYDQDPLAAKLRDILGARFEADGPRVIAEGTTNETTAVADADVWQLVQKYR